MEVMKPIQDRFVLICICPSKTNDPFIKIRNVVIAVLFFLIITCYGFGCACCIGKNFKTDFEGSLQATVIMSGSWALTYMMLASFFLRNQFTGLFGAFQNLYDKYKYMDTGNFMQTANERSAQIEKYADYFTVMCSSNLVILMILSIVYSYWKYGYLDSDNLYRPTKIILPWDQNCLSGWIIQGVYDTIAAAVMLFVAFIYSALFISLFFFNLAFYQIFREHCKKIDSLPLSTPFRTYQIKKKLVFESIEFHILAKELFQQTAHVYGSLILVFLINTIVTLATSVLEMDLAVHDMDPKLVLMSYVTVYGMLHLYAYCYVGKKSTDFFLAFADCLYESNWMALPLELRRSFPLMISHAHRPLHYHGFHVAILNLELFSKLMFKTLVDF